MYTTLFMKFNHRARVLAFRLTNPAYTVFLSSCLFTYVGFRHLLAYGPQDTHRAHAEAPGSYSHGRYLEINDNPIYRLPEHPAGGHRDDFLSPQQARRANLQSH